MTKHVVKNALILLCCIIGLSGCESLENEGGKDFVKVRVIIDQPAANSANQSYSASSVLSAAIFAVPASVTVDTLDQIENAYDGQKQNLVDGTVILSVPLNEALKLVKLAFNEDHTLVYILTSDPDPTAYGISQQFTVTGADEEKIINITMATGVSWGGTVQYGTAGYFDVPLDMVLDSQGNIYLSGYARGDLDGQSNQAPGSDDVFITKFDPSGVKQWTKLFGTVGSENPHGAVIDSSGNIYVTGDTGANEAIPPNTSFGNKDVFLAKYNSNGDKVYIKQFGTADGETGMSLMIASNGKVYLVGNLNSSWPGFTNPSPPDNDIYIMNVDSDGTNMAIVEQASSTTPPGFNTEDRAEHAIMDSSNNIYITGVTGGTFTGTFVGGDNDAFFRKYDSDGTVLVEAQFGTSSNESGVRLALDSAGNIYIVGATSGTFTGQTSAGAADFFLVKYNAGGTQQWLTQFGSTDDDTDIYGLKVTDDGIVYFLAASVGDFPPNSNSDSSKLTKDIVLAKFNASTGAQISVKTFGTIEEDAATDMEVDSSGNILLTGMTNGSMDGTATPDSEGQNFLLKMDSDMNILTN